MGHDNREDRPWWVKLGLWGLPNRASAWACMSFAIGIALACVAYGFVDMRFFTGGGMVFAALWYWACIRWVDQHGRW